MGMDLETFLTAVYTLVDDLYRERVAGVLAHRPGPAPSLSDSEVLTLAICAEWGPWDSERGFWRFVCQRLGHLFPRLVDQSEFNRRRRSLYPALATIQRAVAERLGVHLERERLLDTKPVVVMVLKRHDDRGLLFVSFQKQLRTFVATQHRLVEGDAMMRYVTTTASSAFLILPGFTPDQPLGLG